MLSVLIAMLSVLIVEDHQAVREALTEAFLGWGHRVTAAASLDQANALTAGNSFDLMVTDVDLNGGDGLELVRTLAPLRPQAAFLVISGRIGRKEVLGSGLEIGERLKYLKKPFLLSELQAVVTEFERHWPAGTN